MKRILFYVISICLSLSCIAEEVTTNSSYKQRYPSFADIIDPLMPAVVNIYTVHYGKKSFQNRSPFPEGFPFDHFNEFFEQFNMPFNFEEMYSDPKAVALGSGFIIDPAGYIVTNHHVVANADEIRVKLSDNTELPAKLIGSDQKSDLALLKVETNKTLPAVRFGNSANARVGDWVIAIGNPFGLGGTVTTGIISSKGRDIGADVSGVVDDFIQTDAAINSGNSGGPMFNIDGQVIGVNTAIFSPSGTNIGIGFSIPSNTASNIIEQLKKNGKVSRGLLNVTIQEVTSEIAEGLGLKEVFGALVVDVQPGGCGDKAGIKSGDVIIEFANHTVKNSRKLQVLVAETPVDTEVKIVVLRNGKHETLTAKITESDKEIKNPLLGKNAPKEVPNTNKNQLEKSGITFMELTDENKARLGIRNQEINGIVVSSIKAEAKRYGLSVGDVITAANQHPIANLEEFNKQYKVAVDAKKKNIILLVKRRGLSLFVALPLK